MKSDTQQSMLNQTQFSLDQQIQPQITIQCSNKKQAYHFCVNDKCKCQSPFTCLTKNCQCHKKHGLCLKGNIQDVLQIIHAKIQQTDIKDFIQKLFDKLIDQLSQFRDNLLTQLQKMKYIGLHEIEKKILQISKNQIPQTQINNKQTAQLWKIISNKSQTEFNVFEKLRKDLESFQGKFNHNYQTINKTIASYYQTNLSYQQKLVKSIVTKSLICKYQENAKRMINMFNKLKPIKNIQSLFRASQHQFDISKFFNLCNTQNVVILTLTDKEKIFGGYTPLNFTNNTGDWITDAKKESFLFSISQNQKFQLVNNQYAILSQQNAKIHMGCDFEIVNKANINKNQIGYRHSYINQKYQNNDQSYLKLNGNLSCECYLKEWQVFKIQFQTN